MPLPKDLKVLISGAGIAGPVAAYWLGKAGVSVSVLERADGLRKEGQTIDIRGEGIQIMKWMGVEEEVRKRTTKELGLKFVDSKNRTWGVFPQTGQDKSFTSEFEIVRSELASVFYEASREMPNVEYIFGDSIESTEETTDSIKLTLKNDKSRRMEYDILIIAEGLTSRTRAKVFEEDVRAPIQSLNMWAASFSFEKGPTDEDWARWYAIPKRRAFLVRPDGFGRIRTMASCLDDSESMKLIASSRTSVEKQKEYFIDIFKGSGWESDRILEGLRTASDLYVQEIAQTKAKTWSKGRAVLLGDSAFCPSAITGLGTTTCIAGAYFLAAEIVKNPTDHRAAFNAYESSLRPWIQQCQKLLPAGPRLGHPETELGVKVLHIVVFTFSLVLNSRFFPLLCQVLSPLGWFFGSEKGLKLPDPSMFKLREDGGKAVQEEDFTSKTVANLL